MKSVYRFVHKLHHEQINLSAFDGYYLHPIEFFIKQSIHCLVFYYVDVDLLDNYIYSFIEYFGVFYAHYGYNLPHLTFLNERHDFHHSITF